jgi:hypothetical protein
VKPVLSQIVHLAKNLLLQPERPGQPCAQFIAGKQSPLALAGGIGLTWWYGDQMFQATEAVARLVIGSSADYRDCDVESVKKVVATTMQELSADRSLFDLDAILFGRRKALLDCCRVPVPQFAEAVLRAIQANLAALIGQRCTIFAVPRVIAPSFSVPHQGLHLIAPNDVVAWQAIVAKGYQFDTWSPSSPTLGRGREFSPPSGFTCLLVSEDRGTPNGTRFNGSLKFRKLLAVLVAIVSERADRTYRPSAAPPFEFCMQFPHASSADGRAIRTQCGPLLPYYVSDIAVTAADVKQVQEWYEDCELCAPESRDRVEKAAHFLNRAMNADDIEAYINYFVALDALFGQRGSVEASILRGVRELQLGPTYVEKASWLFDFRNEIVHGSSRFIAECPKYERYVEHFKRDPTSDLQKLAQLAVIHAPRIAPEQWLEIAAGVKAGTPATGSPPVDFAPESPS